MKIEESSKLLWELREGKDKANEAFQAFIGANVGKDFKPLEKEYDFLFSKLEAFHNCIYELSENCYEREYEKQREWLKETLSKKIRESGNRKASKLMAEQFNSILNEFCC